MEVRPGYKRTEVGVIPEDWNVAKIGDYAYVTKLAGFEYTDYFDYSKSGPIIAVRALNIKNGTLDLSDIHTIPRETSEQLPRSQLSKGDLVVSYVGTLGRVAIIPEDRKYHLAPNVAKISVDERIASPFYLNQFLNSNLGQKEILKLAASTTQAALSMQNLRKVICVLPPLPEQRAIAAVLSDVDALIAALDRLIAKKRAIKQSAMQELLTGKTRLPGFSGEWEVKKLGEIGIKFLNGGTPSTRKTEYWDGNIPWITGADVVDQRVSNTRRFITEDAVRNSATNVVEQGNLLIVTRTGVGKLAIAPFDLAISQDLTGVYLKNELALPEYVFKYLDYNSSKLTSLNQGTSIAGITRETLMSMIVSFPSLPEQRAIAAVLSDMDAEIAALEARRDKTRALKQGMMQELLTGKTRLV